MIDRRIKTIQHEHQRYETIGDYIWNGDHEEIRVSDMGNENAEFACGVHELIESHLCRIRGIDPKAIDDFDMQFEEETKRGLHKITDEPGDDPRAPYFVEHQFALTIEKLVCREMGLDWDSYGDLMMEFFRKNYEQ